VSLSLVLSLLLVGGGSAEGIRWERRFDDAMLKAKAIGKPVMVDFWAEWCGWCHRLDQTTYVDPVVVGMAKDFVPVKVDTESGARASAIALKYDVSTLPTVLFLSPSGKLIYRLSGFQGPGQFPRTLESARKQAQQVMGWEADLERDPRNAAALSGLGIQQFEQESYDISKELLVAAVRTDAERPVEERKHVRLLAGILLKHVGKTAEAEALLREALTLKPAGAFEAKLLYMLGKTYIGSGKRDEARTALQQLITVYPDSPVADKAREALVALEPKPKGQ
jgi:thioredoxin-like negative regulator of GroEL